MINIGIIYGSNTGRTKKIAFLIYKKIIKYYNTSVLNISNLSLRDFLKFNVLILGVSTWYNGKLQQDWHNFLPVLKKIDFKKKIVAFFGCGNQKFYKNYFCNAISILHNIVIKNNAKIIGYYSTYGYKFKFSKSLYKDKFMGLCIDEDNQSELSKKRVSSWVNKIVLSLLKK